jgi:hypothetical protein
MWGEHAGAVRGRAGLPSVNAQIHPMMAPGWLPRGLAVRLDVCSCSKGGWADSRRAQAAGSVAAAAAAAMTVTRPPTAAMADLEAQIASLTELIAQHPRRVDLVFGRASAYRSAGKLELAVADFAKVRARVCVSLALSLRVCVYVCVCVCPRRSTQVALLCEGCDG